MKQPHPVVQKFWDERHQTLSTFVQSQLKNMEENTPTEIKDLENNLFVDADLAEVVRKNFVEVEKSLKELGLRLEKLQFAYTNV